MSYMGNHRDLQSARSKPAGATLSMSLAKMLFGAAIGTIPGMALAADDEAATTAMTATAVASAVGEVPVTVATIAALPSATERASVADMAAAVNALSAAQSGPLGTLPVGASAEQRTYGPSRPGIGTPANTMNRGEVSIEMGFADWQRDDHAGVRSDTLLIGSTTVRVGLSSTIEAMAGWTPFGHVRTRDAEAGTIAQANRVGDATLGFKANLANPDGSRVSVAVEPFVVVPIGRAPVGVGDWGGGVVLPASCDVSRSVNLQLTGEADAATNSSGTGRHLSYSLVGGVNVAIVPAVKATGELAVRRDNDPVRHLTQAFASLSLAWSVRDNLQLDIGSAAGLNADTPNSRLYAGFSRRL